MASVQKANSYTLELSEIEAKAVFAHINLIDLDDSEQNAAAWRVYSALEEAGVDSYARKK